MSCISVFRWRAYEEIPNVVGLKIKYFHTLVKGIYKLGQWARKK
jgi:hypothetical protein